MRAITCATMDFRVWVDEAGRVVGIELGEDAIRINNIVNIPNNEPPKQAVGWVVLKMYASLETDYDLKKNTGNKPYPQELFFFSIKGNVQEELAKHIRTHHEDICPFNFLEVGSIIDCRICKYEEVCDDVLIADPDCINKDKKTGQYVDMFGNVIMTP